MFFKDFVSVKRQKIKRGASQTYDTPSNCYFPRLACKFTCRTWTCSLTWNFYNTMTISTRTNIIVVLWATCSIRTCRKILCNHLSFLILLHNSQIFRLCLYPIERLDFLYYLLPFKRFGIFFMLLFVDVLPFLKCRDISLWLFYDFADIVVVSLSHIKSFIGSPDIFRGKNFLILQKIYTFVP